MRLTNMRIRIQLFTSGGPTRTIANILSMIGRTISGLGKRLMEYANRNDGPECYEGFEEPEAEEDDEPP